MGWRVEALSGYASKKIAVEADASTEFDDLFVIHHRAIYRAAYSVLRDAGLSEDATQEVFLRLHQNLSSAPRGDELRAWLLRVTVNAARNILRGRARASVREERYETVRVREDANPTPEDEYEQRVEVRAARESLGRVREPARSCLLMKQQGFSYREIALALSINETSVGSLVARGRKEFMRFYGKCGGSTK